MKVWLARNVVKLFWFTAPKNWKTVDDLSSHGIWAGLLNWSRGRSTLLRWFMFSSASYFFSLAWIVRLLSLMNFVAEFHYGKIEWESERSFCTFLSQESILWLFPFEICYYNAESALPSVIKKKMQAVKRQSQVVQYLSPLGLLLCKFVHHWYPSLQSSFICMTCLIRLLFKSIILEFKLDCEHLKCLKPLTWFFFWDDTSYIVHLPHAM
jgi:hypothetical protein